MKEMLLVAFAVATLVSASPPALAGEEEYRPASGRDEWLPRDTIEKRLYWMGYRVRRFEADGDCLIAYADDRNGVPTLLRIDWATGNPSCRSDQNQSESSR